MGFKEAIPTQMLLALQKDSELAPLFNFHLQDLIQSGLAARLAHQWLKAAAPPDATERIFSEEARALGYDNLFFPSAVLSFGVAFALALVAAEYFRRKPSFATSKGKRDLSAAAGGGGKARLFENINIYYVRRGSM